MDTYDHYIGLDWAQRNMAIARMTRHSNKISTIDVKTDVEDLKIHLKSLKGRKILTFEETNPAQWLFTELSEYVDEILVCDPRRNHLLKEGGKSDKVDAEKLVQLLRAGLLKPVFHCSDEFVSFRKLISGYNDLVKMGVMQKNRRSAMFRAVGKNKKEKSLSGDSESFVLEGLDASISFYEKQKERYDRRLKSVVKAHKVTKNLSSIPGIGAVGSLTIASTVIDPSRFKDKSAFLSYCGLVKHEMMSGGRSYGRRPTRYSRQLKQAFKVAALTCLVNEHDQNPMYKYYLDLITKKGYEPSKARHALARRIAVLALGVMRSGKKLEEKELLKKQVQTN